LKDPRDDEADQFELTAGPKFNKVYVKMIDTHDLENVTFTDITGELPYTSSWDSNRHIFVLYSYDINVIMMECMKNRDEAEIERVFTTVYSKFKKEASSPKSM